MRLASIIRTASKRVELAKATVRLRQPEPGGGEGPLLGGPLHQQRRAAAPAGAEERRDPGGAGHRRPAGRARPAWPPSPARCSSATGWCSRGCEPAPHCREPMSARCCAGAAVVAAVGEEAARRIAAGAVGAGVDRAAGGTPAACQLQRAGRACRSMWGLRPPAGAARHRSRAPGVARARRPPPPRGPPRSSRGRWPGPAPPAGRPGGCRRPAPARATAAATATPATTPRQPAWTAAQAPVRGSASSSGTQSATKTPSASARHVA